MSTSSSSENRELESFLSKSFLELEEIDVNIYRSKNLWKNKFTRGTYGGQIIGQAMVAASKSIPDDHHLHSFHSYFLQPGNSNFPILYRVENTRDGKTYTSRAVQAIQFGKAIFTMEASFKSAENSFLSYQRPMQDVPSMHEVPEFIEALSVLKEQGDITDNYFMARKNMYSAFPIEIKFIDIQDSLYLSPREPKQRLWFRANGHISEEVNHNVHKCCVGYMSDIFMIPTSLHAHAPLFGKKVFQASLDHCMWFHAPCRADEWMLFDVRTESIGDGRAFCHAQIWNQEGNLVTTITQEGAQRVSSKL